jgi:hypothetical protein
MTYDPDRLRRLGSEHKRIKTRLKSLVPELADEIRTAAAADVPQVEIVEATGYTRDQIRQICLPPDKKRSRAKPKPEQQ